MKKIIAVLLMVTVLMCGCGEGEKQEVSQEQNQEETEKDNSESGNQETEEEIKETEDMSQSEWMESGGADNMEDGYEKVESINIDSSDTKLSYEKLEKYTLENGEEVILLYFDFSNVSAGETTVDGQYNFSAFQDGVEITVYSYTPDEFEPFRNRDKQILDGANIKFGIAVKPDNWESNIKLRVDDFMAYDSQDIPHTFQQQELEIKGVKTEEKENSSENVNGEENDRETLASEKYEFDGGTVDMTLSKDSEDKYYYTISILSEAPWKAAYAYYVCSGVANSEEFKKVAEPNVMMGCGDVFISSTMSWKTNESGETEPIDGTQWISDTLSEARSNNGYSDEELKEFTDEITGFITDFIQK